MRKIFPFLLIVLLMSCNVEKQIERKYEGEGREMVLHDFGEPQKVVDMGNGIERFIYIKETYIRETEIGIGKGTLDPRISPAFIKEETWRFDIDAKGQVVGSNYEKRQK
ncbi:MAG TPA: hypothetical protein VJY41_01075 [Prolixibacteraceae bacterium]|nr:hypothetical protein [Prolixibacteraceae bacterium]